VSERGEYRLSLPLAFDTAIGYWTGAPDWELLAGALAQRLNKSVADRLDAHRRGGPPLEAGGLVLEVVETTLVIHGDPAAAEALAADLARWFARPATAAD